MPLLSVLHEELREALKVVKSAPLVPWGEVFVVRDRYGFAHGSGGCLTWRDTFGPAARWQRVAGSALEELDKRCECLHYSGSELAEFVTSIESVLDVDDWSREIGPVRRDNWSIVPDVLKAWEPVQCLFMRLLLTEPRYRKQRARMFYEHDDIPVSLLPSVGLCTMRYRFPKGLEVFPNGHAAAVPWAALPELAAYDVWTSPFTYELSAVEGWSAERVAVFNSVIHGAASPREVLATFDLTAQLVP